MHLLLATLLVAAQTVHALENGLGRTPPMGWNSWNLWGCTINETIVRETAEAIVSLGLDKLGYTYVNVDDCWQTHRNKRGKIVADTVKFPSGMKHLADHVHSLGLKFGIYSDAGNFTCAGRPGSLDFEELDAETYAKWGVDYLKYDNCYNTHRPYRERYIAMRDALNKTGRPIFYSLCEWGVYNPWEWADDVANSWRTTDDIVDEYNHMVRVADNSMYIAQHAKPGAWNDLDMLEVGNGGMSVKEYEGHFAVWAITKSPLLIGCDVRNMSEDTMRILTSKEVIAMNQDALGVAGDVVYHYAADIVYAAPLADGSRAVVMWNRHTHDNAPEDKWGVHRHCKEGDPCKEYPANGLMNAYNVTITWDRIGLQSDAEAVVRDLNAEKDIGVYVGKFTHLVNAHGVLVLKIKPVDKRHRDTKWRPWHTNQAPCDDGGNGGDGGSSGDDSDKQTPGYVVLVATLAVLVVVGLVGGFYVYLIRTDGGRARSYAAIQEGEQTIDFRAYSTQTERV